MFEKIIENSKLAQDVEILKFLSKTNNFSESRNRIVLKIVDPIASINWDVQKKKTEGTKKPKFSKVVSVLTESGGKKK